MNTMASISKRQTTPDRISNLPTSLISYILSFLSTKDAVKTSALSTHWNQHWTSITRLDFDDGHYIIGKDYDDDPASGDSFLNFVYRVLLFKVTCLDSFRLRCGPCYDVAHVRAWISVALSRHVRQIDLAVYMGGIHKLLPDSLFSSKTLVVLKLGREFFLRVPKIISLESLKILHLFEVEFEDNESLSRLVSSCPALEELQIDGELSKRVNVVNISSRLLKKLILYGLYSLRYSEIFRSQSFKVVLDTPSLEYFEHVDNGVPDGYQIETLRCLDTAWLCLRLSNDQLEEYDDEQILARPMTDLAIAISNVRVLYLSEHALKAFNHIARTMPNFELPKFPHLTDLKIDVIEADAGMLTTFLQCSPQLAYLSFNIEESLESSILPVLWDPPTDVPFCMLHNLWKIEVDYLRELELGVSMVKYFLEKTNSLKQLIIPRTKAKNAEVIKEVLMLPIASKSCKIVLT